MPTVRSAKGYPVDIGSGKSIEPYGEANVALTDKVLKLIDADILYVTDPNTVAPPDPEVTPPPLSLPIRAFRGLWKPSMAYNKGDFVNVGNVIYAAKVGHTSGLSFAPEFWETFLTGGDEGASADDIEAIRTLAVAAGGTAANASAVAAAAGGTASAAQTAADAAARADTQTRNLVTADWFIAGHSYSVGVNQENVDKRFGVKLAARFGGIEQNIGVSGSCLCNDDASQPGGWARILQRARPGAMASVLMYGVNDCSVNSFGTGGRADTTYPNCLRAGIVACRQKEPFHQYDDATHTATTGTWTVPAAPSTPRGLRDRCAGSAYVEATAAASKTITLPTDYNGEPISLIFIVNGANAGAASATLSGTAGRTDVIDLTPATYAVSATRWSVRCFRIKNLTAANAGQTIVISRTTGTVGYNGYFTETLQPSPVMVANIAKFNPYSGFWAAVTNAQTVVANGIIAAVVAEFDSQVQLVDIDTPLAGSGSNPQSAAAGRNFASDKSHPSDEGQGLMYTAFKNKYLTMVTADLTVAAEQRGLLGTPDLETSLWLPNVASIPDTTATTIYWQGTERDTAAAWDAFNTNRITARADGRYEVLAHIPWDSGDNAVGSFAQLLLSKNGDVNFFVARGPSIPFLSTHGIFVPLTTPLSARIDLKKGEYVSLYAFQRKPTASARPFTDVHNTARFSMRRIARL